MCSRFLKALCYTFGAIIISVLILFISWAFLKYVDLPYTEISVGVNETGNPEKSVAVDATFTLETSLVVYIIAIMSFFGWIFVVLFGGVGMFGLPIDMINTFRHRPKARTSSSMKKTKDRLI